MFVGYGVGHRRRRSLIRNPADYASAPIWTAYDRGEDNARLVAVAGNRTVYIYDERWMRLERPDGSIVAVAPVPP